MNSNGFQVVEDSSPYIGDGQDIEPLSLVASHEKGSDVVSPGDNRLPAIELTGLQHTYPASNASEEQVVALKRLDLTIPAGQFVALVGASGCGKTTLLNLVAGLLFPSEGEVTVHGDPVRGPVPSTGYMFARDGLLPWRNVRRNVELGLEHRKVPRAERHARSEELLQLVGLQNFMKAYPRNLSQGMRQRAALARTLATSPQLLLMDEPFAALDARTKLRLQSEFLEIWESQPQRDTVLFVTHDLNEAVLMADRVIVMLPRPGRIASDQLVDLPRPRAGRLGELMFDPSFARQARDLFDLLESDLGAVEEAE